MNRSHKARLEKLEAAGTDCQPYIIAGENVAECEAELARLTAEGRMVGRKPILVATGVPRADGERSW